MADFPLLKDMIDAPLVEQLAGRIGAVHPAFERERFVSAVMAELESLELKARFNSIADQLRRHLPEDIPLALDILVAILDESDAEREPIAEAGLRLLPIPAFVERHCVDHPEAALDAIYCITRQVTCEAAIRPFIARHPKATMDRLRQWALDENEHVRRLVSEGSRPRLPWAPQLRAFIADPTPALALLELLKDDPSLYVRRSVANHLNDISKDHPAIVLERMACWARDAGVERSWLINHALRSLVKAGDARALEILGFGAADVELVGLRLSRAVQFGGELEFAFELRNRGLAAQKLMVDFALHLVKANGARAAKVFKLKRLTLAAGASAHVSKRFAIKPISTRRYYPGSQRLEIQVNGRIVGGADFELIMD